MSTLFNKCRGFLVKPYTICFAIWGSLTALDQAVKVLVIQHVSKMPLFIYPPYFGFTFVTNKGAFCHGFKAFQHLVGQLWLKKPSIRTYTEAFKYRTQALIAPDTCPGIVL